MSAIHHGYAHAVPNATGRMVYTGTSVEHAVPGWTRPASAQVPVLIPAQRRGNDLDDLTPFTQIPQLGQLARELLGAGQDATEVQPWTR